MSEFLGIFVEEAREHLQEMEAMLLALRIDTVTTDDLNKIFRAAHSIKGGSATFGLNSVTELAHVLESLLDRLRDRRLALTTEMVDALLRSTDLLGEQISEHEGRGTVDARVVEELCERIRRLTESPASAASPIAPSTSTPKPAKPLGIEGVAFGFFDDAEATPASLATPPLPPSPSSIAVAESVSEPGLLPTEPRSNGPAPVTSAAAVAAHESSSIRVGVEKVDQIINLVGELVITQAMLAQCVDSAGTQRLEKLKAGLDQLDRNTRALQEAAMAIRMMPISAVFNRFPRVVRDVAARLGKEVDLKLVGEGTELDKGLIERIVDPLTHLVRNSLDHGLEAPAERIACGKPVKGTITLRASHQGGNIVIEVSDDGRGLSRERILAKARERGIAVADNPSDGEVWALIFEAGFSTADKVTDVSGRGVGMDVVRSNIHSLGGRVEIHSEAGLGTRMTVRLPLTLAILDGMSVSCGGETFIVPLTFIVESLRPSPESIRTVGSQGRVLQIRGKYLPMVTLHELLGMSAPAVGDAGVPEEGILIVIDTEEMRMALLVDALLGQHQVVIKSLETNYRKVPGISGATIMGDGRVALILDAAGLGRLAASQRRERELAELASAFPGATASPTSPALLTHRPRAQPELALS
ncbi:chemotaxis protein CheW (plasmid) [Comamonadaceae bacterium OTU4NAUVB1]|nr:chemotaxis protein CheW [Comamonadaceae bacterium OTU4NAUVB1]